jgi:hypothetical protein
METSVEELRKEHADLGKKLAEYRLGKLKISETEADKLILRLGQVTYELRRADDSRVGAKGDTTKKTGDIDHNKIRRIIAETNKRVQEGKEAALKEKKKRKWKFVR